MNKKILKNIIKNKYKIVPSIFTIKQIDIIEKYLKNIKLKNSEKTYFYSTITKKINAIESLNEEFYVYGNSMIENRVLKAKEILKDINGDAFISGTFLFAKKYQDIDIYIVGNKRKQFHKDKKHFIYITKKDLQKSQFYSALLYCVSNFFITLPTPLIKRQEFDELVIMYELAINEILDNDDQKMIRDIIAEYNSHIKGKILDSYQLYNKFINIKKLNKNKKIQLINNMAKELILKLYSKTYLYNTLGPFIKQLKETINDYKTHDNIIIYRDLMNNIKNECRRVQT